MSDEPKKPATPVADAIDAAMPDTRPGADVTDGATGRPYSQVGEKSAGELLYERWVADRINPDRYPSWGALSAVDQRRHEFEAGKSAGQLAYEKETAIPRLDPATGKECSPLPPYWDQLPPSEQKRWNFNATVTPKNQTIKAP
ncbi:MAG: hypothetical protein V3W06_06620 [Acidimicrobiia bacterium]